MTYRDRRTSTNKQITAMHKPTHCNCCGASDCKLYRVAPNNYYCPECRAMYKDWRKHNKGTTNK